ncbi:MAG TPA: YqeG family HAD IIIA-type phosphatase [Candidatus Nitrosotenuis sp.]|jgi:HAD superfamily phosphatase (TIGR01668 family)|nr:YqeG family HAD IIIA-type phosphatase [Candidatus Nitrosotenuis sp.]
MSLSQLCPGMWVQRVEHIDLEELRSRGFVALFFDLDNTLVSWRHYRIRPEILAWIERARELGFRMCGISNCLFGWRVRRLSQMLQVPAIPRARKPGGQAYRDAMALVRSRPENTVVIGDQLFTDILGGNRMGFFTILVNPVDRTEYLALTPIVYRLREKLLLFRLRRRGMLRHVQGQHGRMLLRSEPPAPRVRRWLAFRRRRG